MGVSRLLLMPTLTYLLVCTQYRSRRWDSNYAQVHAVSQIGGFELCVLSLTDLGIMA
jgi:hypothetical protein